MMVCRSMPMDCIGSPAGRVVKLWDAFLFEGPGPCGPTLCSLSRVEEPGRCSASWDRGRAVHDAARPAMSVPGAAAVCEPVVAAGPVGEHSWLPTATGFGVVETCSSSSSPKSLTDSMEVGPTRWAGRADVSFMLSSVGKHFGRRRLACRASGASSPLSFASRGIDTRKNGLAAAAEGKSLGRAASAFSAGDFGSAFST